MRFLIKLLLILVVLAGAAWFFITRSFAPSVQIRQPTQFVGANGQYEIAVSAPEAELTDVRVTFEQNGQVHELTPAGLTAEGDSVIVRGPLNRAVLRGVTEGTGVLRASAARLAYGKVRTNAASAEKELQVRLQPPKLWRH